MAGVITVDEEGFENGTEPHSAFVDVEAPGAFVDANGLGWDNGQVVVPIKVTGVKADELTEGDVKFDKGVTVTKVKTDDDTVYAFLDVEIPGASAALLRAAADFLDGQTMI